MFEAVLLALLLLFPWFISMLAFLPGGDITESSVKPTGCRD